MTGPSVDSPADAPKRPTPIGRLNRSLMVLAAFWAFFLAIVITTDVAGRGLFDRPLAGAVEIVANSIVLMVFLQAGEVVRSRSMLRADFLVESIGPRASRALEIGGCLAGALLFGLIAYGCVEPAMTAYERGEFEGEALRVPTWPIYATIVFGSVLAAVNYVVLAFEYMRSVDGRQL